MASEEKPHRPFGDVAGVESPALADALFSLNSALTYEDFADAVELFLESAVPHASRLVMVGTTKLSPHRYSSLIERGTGGPLPGVEYIPDWEMRMRLSAKEREILEENPDKTVWSLRQEALSAYGVRDGRDFHKTEFFRRVMEPEQWIENIFVPFRTENGALHSGFWIKRAEGQTAFSKRDRGVLEQYHPWMLAALRRVRALEDAHAHNHDIAVSLFDIPVATFLLDWGLRLQQHNAAASRACAAWFFGPQQARIIKVPEMTTDRVPAAIRTVCLELRERWLADNAIGITEGRDDISCVVPQSGAGYRRRLPHPEHPQLEATVTLLRPHALRLAMPSFLVRIVNLGAGGAVAGRCDGVSDGRHVQLLTHLTQAERDVAPLVAEGLSDKEIATVLGKSVPTVKKQLRSIYEKLRVPNRARLIALLK